MVERIRELLNRFPEDEAVVRQLIEWNPDFDALCESYHNITRELSQLEGVKDPTALADAKSLRNRRNVVEEELLAKIEGHRPV
jgi:glutamate mutase epsilon subunit